VNIIGWLKPALFVLSLVPFARLVLLGYQDALGANPIEFITRSTGFWTLTFLCLTLTVTPLRRLTGWPWLIRLRRMVGLFAFFYALLHFTTYVWFDQWFSLQDIVKDIGKRPFITVGFAAFLLLLPLAFTSTNRMMRRLGRRWAQLHRLVYLIAGLGVVHFWWLKQGKNDLSEPWIFSLVVAALLLFRLVARLRRASGAGRPLQPALRGQQIRD
jgi:sulfoxide reductase heme-binding subunit YedZ